MARLGRSLLLLFLCGTVHLAAPQEVSETSMTDVLSSLTHLAGALSNTKAPCKDKLETIWSGVGKISVMLENKVDAIIDLLDDITRAQGLPTAHQGCGRHYERRGGSCYSSWRENPFPWWRSRTLCWVIDGEMLTPNDLEEAKEYLKDKGNHTYWIGARTFADLEIPDWISIEGERVQAANGSILTIQRSTERANCLAISGNNSYQIESRDCEEKLGTICKKKFNECRAGFKKVGDSCLRFHRTPAAWQEAKEACLKENGTLVFHSDFQMLKDSLATEMHTDNWTVWTAGTQASTDSPIKNALKRSESLTVTWSHDTSHTGREACIGVTHGEFVTKRLGCDEELPYFCLQD